MADKTELLKLAAELKEVDRPDRMLDARIYCAMHDGCTLRRGYMGVLLIEQNGASWRADETAPAYTSSVDCALSLKPEGGKVACEHTGDWHWWSCNGHEAAGKPEASVARLCSAVLSARAAA